MSESRFRKVMKWVLSEGPEPDEPGLEPDEYLGQWVLPDKRGLGYLERYSELEAKLLKALDSHYMENWSSKLESIWDELMELSKAGLYKDWLHPPVGSVYRGMTLKISDASRLLGIPEDEITANDWYSTEEAMVQDVGGTYAPRENLSSWTVDSGIASGFIRPYVGEVAIILRAQCAPNGAGGGEFLMNPDKVPDEFPHIDDAYPAFDIKISEEEEVISNGPVRWDRAAWVYIDPLAKGERTGVTFSKSEIKAIKNSLGQAVQ